jgi:hypothetical protein
MAVLPVLTGWLVEAVEVPADWHDLSHPDAIIEVGRDGRQYDKRAGMRRNAKMHMDHAPSLVIAFPGGVGTAGMAFHALRHGTPTLIVEGGIMRLVRNDTKEEVRTPIDVS